MLETNYKKEIIYNFPIHEFNCNSISTQYLTNLGHPTNPTKVNVIEHPIINYDNAIFITDKYYEKHTKNIADDFYIRFNINPKLYLIDNQNYTTQINHIFKENQDYNNIYLKIDIENPDIPYYILHKINTEQFIQIQINQLKITNSYRNNYYLKHFFTINKNNDIISITQFQPTKSITQDNREIQYVKTSFLPSYLNNYIQPINIPKQDIYIDQQEINNDVALLDMTIENLKDNLEIKYFIMDNKLTIYSKKTKFGWKKDLNLITNTFNISLYHNVVFTRNNILQFTQNYNMIYPQYKTPLYINYANLNNLIKEIDIDKNRLYESDKIIIIPDNDLILNFINNTIHNYIKLKEKISLQKSFTLLNKNKKKKILNEFIQFIKRIVFHEIQYTIINHENLYIVDTETNYQISNVETIQENIHFIYLTDIKEDIPINKNIISSNEFYFYILEIIYKYYSKNKNNNQMFIQLLLFIYINKNDLI